MWLEEPIPITDMLIHRITGLSYTGENPAITFGGKASEHALAEGIKEKFKLVKKPRGYTISSISDLAVKVATQILEGKVMRKCRTDEVSAPVIALAAQCVEGVQFNWARCLCGEFLVNYCEVQDHNRNCHYAWLLLSIMLVDWELPAWRDFNLTGHATSVVSFSQTAARYKITVRLSTMHGYYFP